MVNLKHNLKQLKTIKLDEDWKKNNRIFLMAEVEASLQSCSMSYQFFNRFIYSLFQPVGMVVSLLLVLISSGVWSSIASRQSNPGDYLYTAKKLTERAQLAITFNEMEKAKLNLEFAQKRVEELKTVASQPENNQSTKKEVAIQELTQEVKKEINNAKNRLPIRKPKVIKQVINPTVEKVASSTIEENKEDGIFSVANFKRSDKGIEVYTPKDETVHESLDQAEKLIEAQDYNGTLDQVKKATDLIDNPEIVNTEIATTTVATTTDDVVK